MKAAFEAFDHVPVFLLGINWRRDTFDGRCPRVRALILRQLLAKVADLLLQLLNCLSVDKLLEFASRPRLIEVGSHLRENLDS